MIYMLETYLLELNTRKKPFNFGTEHSTPRHQKKRCEEKSKKTDDCSSCWLTILTRVFIFVYVAQTSACLGCRDDQVTWRSDNKAQNDTCLPCIDCPDGMEPSISCGTVAKYGTHLHCVVCKEGTYSNSYGKEQCTPCSLCSVGRTVTRNCSATKNTLCGPCSYGYYMNHVVLSCLRCSICCWDGKDQFESQCEAQGLPKHRQCKPRHDDGCQSSTIKTATSGRVIVITTNPAATPRTRKRHTRRSTLSIPSTRQESFISTVNPQDEKASSLPLSTTEGRLRKGITTAVSRADQNKSAYGKARTTSVLDDGDNETRVIIGVSFSLVILILLVVIFKRNKIAHFLKWARCRPICRPKDSELGEHTESTTVDDLRAPVSVEVKGVLLPLGQLKSVSLDAYQKVWKRLDKQPEGTKKGDFRNVAEEFKFEQEDIWELEKEFKTSGSGSPSRHLLEGLGTKRPELTVFEFIKVLQIPNIDRDDIVDILKDYVISR